MSTKLIYNNIDAVFIPKEVSIECGYKFKILTVISSSKKVIFMLKMFYVNTYKFTHLIKERVFYSW
jgi:hypothetical protein